jgi:hypothetical protein
MSNIPRRRFGELQRGVFKILIDHPEGIPAKDHSTIVKFPLPDPGDILRRCRTNEQFFQ